MGARNTAAALSVNPEKLSDRARLVLVVMALYALDRKLGPARLPRLYYGGRELICYALGWVPTSASIKRVDRALRELTRAGLVERIGTGTAPGRAQTYRLNLPVDNPVDNSPRLAAPTRQRGTP